MEFTVLERDAWLTNTHESTWISNLAGGVVMPAVVRGGRVGKTGCPSWVLEDGDKTPALLSVARPGLLLLFACWLLLMFRLPWKFSLRGYRSCP